MANSLENIGPMIRNERLRKGLTQEELGERVGVGKAQISKIREWEGAHNKDCYKGTRCSWSVGFCCFEK